MKSKIVYVALALVLVFSLAAVVVPESPAMAADTWYVDGANGTDDGTHGTGPGTDAFKTIQYSINDGRVGSGDTIIVAAGTYSATTNGEVFPIVVSKSVTLKGAQADVDPRPSSGGRSDTESVIDAEETSNAVVQISVADVEINGFTITGGIRDMVEEKDGYSADRLLFRYNILYDDLGTCEPGDDAIQICYSDSVVIEYNYAYNICEDAFNISYATKGVIRCNEARDIYSQHGAIYCYDATGVDIIGNILRNVHNGNGIKWGDGGQPVTGIVKCNAVHDTILNGIQIEDDESSLTIEKNTIYNAGADGILIRSNADASKITIFDNNIYGNTVNGLTNNDAVHQVDAENNWWGCATGPGTSGCDTVAGLVDYVPWLSERTEECEVCGEGGGACFIATAAYGTSSAAEIDTLRAFRDEVLLESTLGSQLVEFYYQTSPPVADFISGNSLLRTIVRELVIDPMVSVATFTQGIWGK